MPVGPSMYHTHKIRFIVPYWDRSYRRAYTRETAQKPTIEQFRSLIILYTRAVMNSHHWKLVGVSLI